MPNSGGNLDTVRRGNLATVLRLVHRSGGMSRAEITAATGLNRSTVGALVADLAVRDLVIEGLPGSTNRVGRPSPVVSPAAAPVAIAVNPEVDAVVFGVVGLGARVDHRRRIPVDGVITAEQTAALVATTIDELRGGVLADRSLVAVGLAVPGPVRASDGLVRWGTHLGWRDAPLGDLVAAATGLPAVVGNDANLGALAESLFGAGRDTDDLVYLNGGPSGIGGGVIAEGRPLLGKAGYAGEFGQNRPAFADPSDRRSEGGVLEDEVNRARLLAVLGLSDADEAEFETAVLASRDPALVTEVARQRRILATGLANAVNGLDPELVVLGGFLSTLLAVDPAGFGADVAAQTLPMIAEGLSIVPAALGPERLLIGAAELAFAALLADPVAAARD